MATTTTKPDIEMADSVSGIDVPAWPTQPDASSGDGRSAPESMEKPSQRDALQALLAFSALHDQLRRRKALAARQAAFDSEAPAPEFDPSEQFVLDEVLQLVAERAVTITGADGLAIALAENNEIVLRAAAGMIRPDPGTRIDRDSAFSGACFRTAQIVICDDTETDPRVNLQSCRKLGARSMVAVPLCGRRRVIGVLEAFSSWPFAFNEIDVRNLSLLAELVLAALKPEDEDRFAQSAQAAATKLETPKAQPPKIDPLRPVDSIKVDAPKPVAPKLEPPKVEPPKPAITAAPTIHAPVLKPTIPPKPVVPLEVPKPPSIPVAAATPATTPVAPPVKPVVPEPPKAATTPAVPVAAVPAAVTPAPAIVAPKPIPPAPAIKPVENAAVPPKLAVPVAPAPKPVETKVTPSVPATVPVPTATKA